MTTADRSLHFLPFSRPLLSAFLALALAACASGPGRLATQSLTTATPAQMVEYIQAAAGDGEGELNVQPLRDSAVEDLRQRAEDRLSWKLVAFQLTHFYQNYTRSVPRQFA